MELAILSDSLHFSQFFSPLEHPDSNNKSVNLKHCFCDSGYVRMYVLESVVVFCV